jgi:hypothetical protein
LIVGLKFCVEITILLIGLQKMDRVADIWVFLLWFIFQPFYIPVMGISGIVGKVTWK